MDNIWLYHCTLGWIHCDCVIGFSIYYSNKVLPDGRKVESYDRRGRFHAKIILFSGIIFLSI